MRFLLLFILMLLPQAALATTSPDQFFELIRSQDRDGVKSALTEAIAEDATGAPDHQRDLFDVFMNTHPDVDSFTTDWLTAEPDNALALTARGWYFYGMGWAFRGTAFANLTPLAAMRKMRAQHLQALPLFQAAISADPDLLAASDGLLLLPATLGNLETITPELTRIMASHPNRGSLMRALHVQAPQWGGDMENIASLCNRFALKIRTAADYTSATCQIDAVYFAHFPPGPIRNRAHDLLLENTNPVLDYARLADATDGIGTPTWRLNALEAQQLKAPLTGDQALAYDNALNEQANPGGFYYPDSYVEALPAEIVRLKKKAEQDPFNATAINSYIRALQTEAAVKEARSYGGEFPIVEADYPFDPQLIGPMLEKLLSTNPYSGAAWMYLAVAHLGDRDLAGIEAAAPYFQNALFYSDYYQNIMEPIIYIYLSKVTKDRYTKIPFDISALSPEELAETDRVIHCPLAKLLVSAAWVCSQRGTPLQSCALGFPENQTVFDRLMQADKRQECPVFHAAMNASLITAPVEANLHSFAP
jgi:hypothetical protein